MKLFKKQQYEKTLLKDDKPKYWTHYCPEEKTVISNLSGEPCNWCDTPETEENQDD